MKQYYPQLSRTVLFCGMQPDELSAILNCLDAKLLHFPKGATIFLEDDPAGFIGVVLEGTVQILRDDYWGNRSILTHADKGDIFAETFSCANLKGMPVSGCALRDCVILMLNCRKMLTQCPHACHFHSLLIQNLLQAMAKKNLILNQKIRHMSQKTTKEKLMAYLLDQAKQNESPEFTIPFDRQSLADYLGVERSAMSAELSKLRKEGILDYKGSWFMLNNHGNKK